MEVVKSVEQLRKATERLSEATREVFRLAADRAKTEREYRIELQKEILILRSEGVQATLIPDIARGKTADLKFERDKAMEMHRSAMQSIQAEERRVGKECRYGRRTKEYKKKIGQGR